MATECDYCGEEFDTTSELSRHKGVCKSRPTNRGGGPAKDDDGGPGTQQNTQIQTADAQGQGGAQETQIQTPEQAEVGGQLGKMATEMVSSFDADDPQTRAAAKSMGAEALSAAIKHLGQKAAEEELQQAQRAQQNAGKSTQVASQSVECANCGGAIPSGQATQGVFECVHCGSPLELTE